MEEELGSRYGESRLDIIRSLDSLDGGRCGSSGWCHAPRE